MKTIKKIDPVVLEFDIVKSKVLNDLKSNLQNEHAKQQAKLYLAKALDKKNIKQLAIANSLKFKSTKLFTRSGNIEGIGNSEEFIKAGFSLKEIKEIYPEIIENTLGYFILQLKENKMPEESEITENIKSLKEQILQGKQARVYQSWMANLRKQNKITYGPLILK
jgi:peptidyl-prolyl cis-trans isomerase D